MSKHTCTVNPTSKAAAQYNKLRAEWLGHFTTLADAGATMASYSEDDVPGWWQTSASVVLPNGTMLQFVLLCRWFSVTGRTHTTAGCFKNGKAITQAAFHAGLDTMLAQASK